MRTLVTVGLCSLAYVSAYAVVGTTSKTAPLAADSAWSFVGKMNGCSAVAIGPHTILTAGHVGAGNFTLGTQTFHMTSSDLAPDVNKNDIDLRIVRVSETLPGYYQIAKSVAMGSAVTMVGYGSTGVVNAAGTGYSLTGGSGTRRAGTNTIDNKATYDPGPCLVSMVDKAGESVLAGGDSGGGWFINGQLVGISAFTLSTNTSKPDYGFSTSSKGYFGSGAVDLTNSVLQAWLNGARALDVNAVTSGRGDRGSVEAVPEPASMSAMGLGFIIVLRRRRSSKK